VPACSPSIQKAEEGGLRVRGQPGMHSETLFQKKVKQIGIGSVQGC
jgi:hypothetical protein